MRLFSGLESLCLAHRRSFDLERTISRGEERSLRKKLEKVIDSHFPSPEDQGRCEMIKEKLSELGRVPLQRAMKEMGAHLRVETDDLWPLFDSEGGPSLSQIRNQLVHGEHFPPSDWPAVMAASDCLRTLLHRFLLASLGWDYKRSKARSYDCRLDDWREYRASLPKAHS